MKNICKYLMMTLMSLFVFASCENFMDRHQEYIEGGEIIYASKPLAIQFNAGREQIEFLCLMENATNVKSIDIFYNNKDNKKDSLIIPVNLSTGLQTVRTILPDMGEKSYTFTVRTTDINGNHSLNTSGVGTSYSELFLSALSNRFNTATLTNASAGAVEINWPIAPGYLIGTELVYRNKNGRDTTLFILPTTTKTGITDAAPAYVHPNIISEFKYRSVYKYESTAMDTVFGDWIRSSFLTLWLAGDATTAAWDGTKIPMYYNPANPGVYEYTGPLTASKELRFLTIRGDFSTYNIRPMVANGSIQNNDLQIYTGGTDLKWKTLANEAGTYKITVNLNEMKVYFVKQ
ncbi:MAG: SusF/SusE family outer membrane protein [Prevotellaceae bacterium]|jgi:hypothetical protein|nr:SusF/SusE family outer membrane protein [Prevotellaceae bacterium]